MKTNIKWIVLVVVVLIVFTLTGKVMYDKYKPYAELDTRYKGVTKLTEKEFDAIPILLLEDE